MVERDDAVLEVRIHHLRRGLAIKGILAGEGVVIDTAHLVEVGAGVEFATLELLGGHEEDRSHHRLLLVHRLHRGRPAELGEAEIEDFELKFPRGLPDHHDVGRLDVAVDDVVRLRGDEGLEGLINHLGEILLGQDTTGHRLVEGLALEQFHHDETALLILPHVEDSDDVGVVQARERLSFGDQFVRRFLHLILGRIRGGEHALDGDFPLELGIEGLEDRAQSAFADLIADFIAFAHKVSDSGSAREGK